MKLTVAIVLFLAACLVTHSGNAQFRKINYYPDSVHVNFADLHAKVTFEIRYIQESWALIDNFATSLTQLDSYLEKSGSDLTRPARIEMTENAKGEKTIRIIPQEAAISTVNIRGDNVTFDRTTWTILINSKAMRAQVTIEKPEDLKALASQNFTIITAKLKEEIAKTYMGRKRVVAGLSVRNGNVIIESIDFPSAMDSIALYGGTGVGVVRDKIYPELTATIGLMFSDHFNRPRHKFELIYNNMFIPSRTENGYTTQVNSFLSTSWNVNLCFTCDRPRWTTIGAGLLVRKSGDYFTGKTMKFFITTDPGNRKINIIPEYYLTDDFKKSSLGLRMTYTF